MELKLRSVKSVTLSSQSKMMAFLFRHKKPEVDLEMRMRYSAPSFSLVEGDLISLWSIKEAREKKDLLKDKIIIFHPGINSLLDPRAWAKMFSDSFYLIICGDKLDRYIQLFYKEVNKVIYSPLCHPLTGVSVVGELNSASQMVEEVKAMSKKKVLTINNTEVDL